MKPQVFLKSCLWLLFLATPAWAGNADMNLTPSRLTLENGQRYATVNIKNNGDATGRYHIEIADTEMGPNGGVKLLEGDERSQFSATKYISIAPRSMTLTSGEFQTIRLLIKNQDEMSDGEYRSTIKVTMTESDLDPATNQAKENSTAFVVRPRLVMAIPIIVRHGNSTFHVNIDSAHFVQGEGADPHPHVKIDFGFEGTRSVIGDVKITHTSESGKDTLLKLFPGIAIYRGVSKISVDIPLEVPDGVNIHNGKTTVTYLAQENEGGAVLAQHDVSP